MFIKLKCLILSLDESGKITNIFSQIMNTKDVSESFSNIEMLSQKSSEKIIAHYNNMGMSADKFFRTQNMTDIGMQNYLKTVDAGKATVDGYQKSIVASVNSFTLMGLKAKAASIGVGLLNAALNAGIMLLASLVVSGVIKWFDELNVTVSEQQQKVDGYSSSLETLNEEYEKLNSRDYETLSQSEKDRLQYLEDRIEYEKELLKIEQARLYKEKVGTDFTDYFDEESLRGKEFSLKMYGDGLGEQRSNIGIYESLLRDTEDLEKKLKTLSPYTREYQDVLREINSNYETMKGLEDDISYGADDVLSKINDANINAQIAKDALNSGYLTSSEQEEAQRQYDFWTDLAKSYEKLYNRMTNAVPKSQEAAESISERLNNSISVDQIKSEFNSEELETLVGLKFDNDATISELRELLDSLNKEAEENPVKTNIDILSGIQTISEDMSKLDEIYADIIDGKEFDYSSILNNSEFKETFGGYTEEYNNFIETITKYPNDVKKCKKAFNNLTTAYINGKGVLEGVTEETKESTIAMLKQMGVANAREVVEAQLYSSKMDLVEAERLMNQEGKVLVNTTYDEINALVTEGTIAPQVGQQLAYFAIQKKLANGNSITTEDDCQELIDLAKYAGYSTEVLAGLEAVKKGISNGNLATEDISNAISNVFKKANETLTFTPEIKWGGGTATKGALEDGKKEAKELLDSYLNLYEKELDAGIIAFDDFLTKSRSMIEQYYADGKISAADYWGYVEDLYKKQLDGYDKVISAVTSVIDDEIEKLEKQKEAVEKNYQAKIDVIQKEIDKLQEANEERQRQYELEKAQYELERALNQRTKKVYNTSVLPAKI